MLNTCMNMKLCDENIRKEWHIIDEKKFGRVLFRGYNFSISRLVHPQEKNKNRKKSETHRKKAENNRKKSELNRNT